ncbi:MAG: NAD-dependent epimerase/dehydratase family protein [Ignavibacterium sp.]
MGKNLIVGFTGGIGRATAKALIESNESVIGFARNIDKAKKYAIRLDNLELIQGDASKKEYLEKAIDGVDKLFYCANIPYNKWEKEAVSLFSVSVDLAIKHNLKLIFPGNVYIYGYAKFNPVNEKHPHQAHTKKGKIRIEMEKKLEEASKQFNLNYTIVRFPDFYGPYVINGFSEQIFIKALKGEKINWFGDLNIPIEFIFIEDAGKAMAMAALSEKSNCKSFNVPGFAETTALNILKEIVNQSKKNSKISALNSDLIFSLIGLLNPIAKEFKEMLYLKRTKLILDGSLFKETFGILPTTEYEEGIRKTLQWCKDFFKV